MPNKDKTSMFRKALTPGIVAIAGLAVTMSAYETTDAISLAKQQIGIRAWEEIGITGTGVVLGSIDGLPPLLDRRTTLGFSEHQSLSSRNVVEIVNELDGILRRQFANFSLHPHQTATLGAMVANKVGSRSDAPVGVAPDAQVLVGWFALDRDQSGGFVDFPSTPSQTIFDSVTYSIFGMTDPAIAEVISRDNLGLAAPYEVATVVNSSFGIEGPAARRGEDQISRIYNAVVTMTDATLVAPTSNDGNVDEVSTGVDDPNLSDLGRVYAPGAAHNTIAVGFITRDFNSVSMFSGAGPIQAQNYADAGLGDLYDATDPTFINPFTPEMGDLESNAGVFIDVRSGPDIVAPGELLRLPAETFVVTGDVFNSVASSQWTGVSFASAIVAASAGLVHELGEREGYSTSSVVTRAVMLNSANKTSDDIPGVGFDNDQMSDSMDEDETLVTTIGLDAEVGAGSLDLVRLLNQYHNGTVITDYMPGDGLEGFTNQGDNPVMQDSLGYTEFALGTDPAVAFVTPQQSNPASPRPLSRSCQESLGAFLMPSDLETMDPWLNSRVETRVASLYGPFNEQLESLIDQASASIMPMARRDDPDLGGSDPDLGNGNNGGNGGTPPANGGDITGGGGATGGGRPFRTGWDHGMIGEGHIDLPIGPMTPGSGISVTLTWNRHESWELPTFLFSSDMTINGAEGNIVDFGGGSGDGGSVAALDPTLMNEFEFENLDLELWQVPTGPGGNRLIAASRGVWSNTECVHLPFVGGAPDGDSDGPLGNAPANYFIRVYFDQTLWDYGGFWFCNGPPTSTPKESLSIENFENMNRAQVEYGLAWYIEFNTDGYLDARRAINPETGAVDISIVGIFDNLDRQFEPLTGDVNADFRVNASDASLLVQNFGGVDPMYDLNNDGIVDALDLEMIAMHIGQVAEPRVLTKEEKKAEKQRRKDYKKSVKERQKTNKKASKQQIKDTRRGG